MNENKFYLPYSYFSIKAEKLWAIKIIYYCKNEVLNTTIGYIFTSSVYSIELGL